MRRVVIILGMLALSFTIFTPQAGAKSSLTKAEKANSGRHEYRQEAEEFACTTSLGEGPYPFKITFHGTRSVVISPLETPTGTQTYLRVKPNKWRRKAEDGTTVRVTFSLDGFVLESWNPDGQRCLTYTRTRID